MADAPLGGTPTGTAAPGTTPSTAPPPALPNTAANPGTNQPSQSERKAIEEQWLVLRDIVPALKELIAWVDAHPEVIQWARGSQTGTFQVRPPKAPSVGLQ